MKKDVTNNTAANNFTSPYSKDKCTMINLSLSLSAPNNTLIEKMELYQGHDDHHDGQVSAEVEEDGSGPLPSIYNTGTLTA